MYRFTITLFTFFFAALNVSQAQCNLFFSEYAEGSSNNKYLEIYNPTDSDISLDGYAYPSVSNAPDIPGEYEYWNAFDNGAIIAAGDVYVIAHSSSDDAILAEADEYHNYLSNGDDGYALVQGTEDNYTVLDMIGDFMGDPGAGWDVAGVSEATKDHTLIRKSNLYSGNAGDWTASAGTNADDSEWIVSEIINDWPGLGTHDFTESCPCIDETQIDPDAICITLVDPVCGCDNVTYDNSCVAEQVYGIISWEQGACPPPPSPGCTNANASNYDSSAITDDGSCLFDNACNVDADVEIIAAGLSFTPQNVTIDLGQTVTWTNIAGYHDVNGNLNTLTSESFSNPESFYYPAELGTSEGVCLGTHVFTIPGIYNYDCSVGNHAASGMVGTIIVGVGGCTDADAPNYNDAADWDDGSCMTSINEIQLGQEASGLYTNQSVNTSGIVTGVFGPLVSVQDGNGEYSGIWVYGVDVNVEVGNKISITATVEENENLTRLISPVVSIISEVNDLPAPEVLATSNVGIEAWEGVLVRVSGEVGSDNLGSNEWSLSDGVSPIFVGDLGYDAIVTGQISLGETFDVIGPVDYNSSSFKIQPRDASDVLLHGCTNSSASNYNIDAIIDDGNCEFEGTNDCSVFISEYAEGSSNNKYIELFNPTSSPVFLDQYSFHRCANGCDDDDFEYPGTFTAGAQIAPGETYILAHSSSDPTILDVANQTSTSDVNFNGDDVWALTQIIDGNIIVIDLIGDIGDDPGNGWSVAGISNATKDHTLVRKSTVFEGNSGDWTSSSGLNEYDSEWIVSETNDWSNLGTHSLTVGCIINTGGCTDEGANNYDPNAATDDGSCDFTPILTIQDIHGQGHLGQVVTSGIVTAVFATPGWSDALGNNASFVIQNNSGPYSAIWCVGEGVTLGDLVDVSGNIVEQNGLLQIQGTSSEVISSSNALPTPELLASNDINDNQWESVLVQVQGQAVNLDLGYGEWMLDDGTGGIRVDDFAYDALEDYIDLEGVQTPFVSLNTSYRVTGPNLFSFGDWKLEPRSSGDVVRLGCTDSSFPNFDPLASEDNGSCANISGCTNSLADNYNPSATVDDGSCVISGCMDPLALNYDVNATEDDSSCYFTLPNIIINEIHYNPCSSQSSNQLESEFVEILNIGDLSADISGFKIYNGETTVGLTFPDGTNINAGEFIVITAEIGISNFEGNGYQVFAFDVASLSNSGQAISLTDAWDNIVNKVNYDDSGDWPSESYGILGSNLIANPDGGCATLEYIPEILEQHILNVIDPAWYNDLGSNWQASWVDGGTPGAPNSSAFGCNDASACNYNPTAYLADNDACEYDCYGCTYATADNYTNGATIDDGTCEFSISENSCPEDLNGDGTVSTGDLLQFLSAFGELCD